MNAPSNERWHQRSRYRALLAIVALATAVAFTVPASARHQSRTEKAHIQGQGGDGVARHSGATLVRRPDGVDVRWAMRTPEQQTYDYPEGDAINPGHPAVNPGHEEVFTLWAIWFNDPDACSDPCNADDFGDTPARGGVVQIDATSTPHGWLRMGGGVWAGRTPGVGAPLDNPLGAEVHVAMAPHGQRLDGDELSWQLNNPVGNPSLWWAAIFLPH